MIWSSEKQQKFKPKFLISTTIFANKADSRTTNLTFEDA